jgi:hypothetical protein
MNQNPSDQKHKPGEKEESQQDTSRTERDRDPQQDTRRRRASMADMQKGQKFTSDEDIIRRRTA